jgi:transcription factor S
MDWFSRPENEEQLRDLRFQFGYTKSFEQLEFLESRSNIREIERGGNLIELEKSEKFRIWRKRLEEKYGTGKNLEELVKLERNKLEEWEKIQSDSEKLKLQHEILENKKEKSEKIKGMFCPECKSLLIFSGGKLKCRKCGYIQKEENLSEKKKIPENNLNTSHHEIPIIQGGNEIKCPICGSFQHSDFGSRVIPKADYEDIRAAWLIQCQHCGHQWLYQYI